MSCARVPLSSLLAACMVCWIVPAQAQYVQRGAQVIYESKHDESLPLEEMAKYAAQVEARLPQALPSRRPLHFIDNAGDGGGAGQSSYLAGKSTTVLLNFDGMDSIAAGGVTPPDATGTVGGNQFVEVANYAYAVYDKQTGAVLLAPTPITTLWLGFDSLCSTTASGQPVVLWDNAASRWIVTQLAYNSNHSTNLLCVAVSTKSNANGTYHRYAFDMGDIFPDSPKYADWPDAFYLSFNRYGNQGTTFQGAEPCALNRGAMLFGGTAAMICFKPNVLNANLLPSNLDGKAPPLSGEPNHYVELGNATNQLNEFDFHVDFVTPKNSTFTGPHAIAVPRFTLICANGKNMSCIPQPSPGETLDSQGDRLMFRLAYRNFGDHESMIVCHTVKPGSGSVAISATRWYELRSTPPGGSFSLYQSGTFQNQTASLWMASMAMDKQGNIAMGMNASSSSLKPSVMYTGRLSTDALGQMEAPSLAVTGSGVQVGGGHAWGNYSSMTVDPTDDCTFWYTQEYYKTNGTNWSTRLLSFKFNSCN